jgi:hypothetical protein
VVAELLLGADQGEHVAWFRYVLTVGRDAGRWSNPIPEKLTSELAPLLAVLGQVVAASERIMPKFAVPDDRNHGTA